MGTAESLTYISISRDTHYISHVTTGCRFDDILCVSIHGHDYSWWLGTTTKAVNSTIQFYIHDYTSLLQTITKAVHSTIYSLRVHIWLRLIIADNNQGCRFNDIYVYTWLHLIYWDNNQWCGILDVGYIVIYWYCLYTVQTWQCNHQMS